MLSRGNAHGFLCEVPANDHSPLRACIAQMVIRSSHWSNCVLMPLLGEKPFAMKKSLKSWISYLDILLAFREERGTACCTHRPKRQLLLVRRIRNGTTGYTAYWESTTYRRNLTCMACVTLLHRMTIVLAFFMTASHVSRYLFAQTRSCSTLFASCSHLAVELWSRMCGPIP